MLQPGELTAVLAAQTLNPSIFTHIWLVRYNLFEEKEITESGSMYSPMAVNVVTADLSFLAIPQRVQVAFDAKKEEPTWCQKALHRTLGVIAKELPHTPFLAVGFNLEWVVTAKTALPMTSIERKCFLSDANPLAKRFQEEDCRFGVYLSKDFTLGRLKLDIKPVDLKDSSQGARLLFNFHLDLTDDKINQVAKFLDHWTEAYETSRAYATELETAWSTS
jgi:hypothetical protein